MSKIEYRLILLFTILGIVVNACSALPVFPAEAPVATPTAEPAATLPAATLEPTPAAVPPADPSREWQRVEIAEVGVSLDVPAGWLRFDPHWLWGPDETTKTRLGFEWKDLQPGTEVEAAMLPSPSQMLDAHPLDLAAGTAMSYTLQVFAPAAPAERGEFEAVETHVIIRNAQGRAYDVFVRAATLDELGGMNALLWHVLESWKLP